MYVIRYFPIFNVVSCTLNTVGGCCSTLRPIYLQPTILVESASRYETESKTARP